MITARRFIATLLLLWTIVTFLAGLSLSGRVSLFPALFHPYWVLGSILIVFGIHYRAIRRLNREISSPPHREALLRHYAVVLGLALACLTGISSMMGFLPNFFHQLVVWPLALLAISESIREIRKN